MDFIAVHSLLTASNDLGFDAFRLAPFAPFRPAALRQQVSLRATPLVAVVIFPERLRAGAMMTVEIPDTTERLRPASLNRLVFRNQKPPFLWIIPLDRPIVTVVAHRILLQSGRFN